MAKTKTAISKIVINLNGQELVLSPKQARELRDILSDLYGSTETIVEKHDHYHGYRGYRDWPFQTWTLPYSTCISAIGGNTTSASNIGQTSTITTSGYVSADNGAASSGTVYLSAVA